MEKIYTPRIAPELIHLLYLEGQETKLPMTKVLDTILRKHYEELESKLTGEKYDAKRSCNRPY